MSIPTLWQDDVEVKLVLRFLYGTKAGLKAFREGRIRPWVQVKKELGL